MSWSLTDAIDQLEVSVLVLRGELRRALHSPTSGQIRAALDETKKLSEQISRLREITAGGVTC